jgi:hypothetical protein
LFLFDYTNNMIREQENTNTEDSQYVYLLQTREFINSNLPVYKIGKTKQTNNLRFNSYPKGSKLFVQLCCREPTVPLRPLP